MTVRLVRPADVGPGGAPELDADQQRVVARRQGSGPIVVLGAPGTGKTTVLVETVVARVERDHVPADGVLVLAPSRTAAAALRQRITTRLDRTVREPLARTPHSYAFGLLRRSRVLDGDLPPRLISGPEQDRVLADLLAGHEEGLGRAPVWPPAISPAVRALRGFRDELRDLLMRAVERGLAPEDLAMLGAQHDRPDWVAAAEVFAEYLDVTSLATPGAFDPAGIVDAAAGLLEAEPDLLDAERERWRLVAVEDAQELTAAAARLVGLLAGGGRDLLLVGDPDVATQGFRGARPRLVAEAADAFRTATGRPGQLVVLRTAHRQPAALREVSARVASRIGSAGAVAQRAAAPPDGGPVDGGQGRVGVHLLASPAQEAAFVAQLLRRRHLDDGIAWSRMAVVVRSSRSTQALRRTLGATGIPVAVPSTEVPVRDEPAVVPLRLALRCVLDPAALTPEIAVELLTGPIGGADALSLRRLRQGLRALELADGGGRASDALLVELLEHPGNVHQLDGKVALAPRRVAGVLAAGREALAAGPGATAESVLWALWQASRLAETWRRVALSGGVAGARADRDLDAVVALFEAAARFVDRLPHAGPGEFLAYLEGQDLPSDPLADRAPSGDAVALVTASGAAGREWDVVAVTGVQEGVWPDLRLRSSLLGAQVLADLVDARVEPGAGSGTYSAQRRAVLDDELRQFHVAVSRARREVVVTAVRSQDLLPSPFLDLVDPPSAPGTGAAPGVDDELRPLAEVPRTMSLPALVAELRATVGDHRLDGSADGADRRRLAALHLARLADAGVPGADPDDWYGLAPLSTTDPLRAPDQAVAVSPSRVESFERCALRWLLEQAGGRPGSTVNVSLGNLIHELAEAVPDGDVVLLRELLARRFPRLGLGEGWVADAERDRAERMVGKLAEYVRRSAAERRTLVATEQQVSVEVGRAVVSGMVDRLERDGDGRLVVVDLKTGRSAPRGSDLARHAQLGVYQLAVEEGGFDALVPPGDRPAGSGGAMLVQLGGKTKGVGIQEQPALAQDEDPQWARRLVESVADGMAAAQFSATVNPMCRMCTVKRSCPIQLEGRQVNQ